jgi:hypothetical protein
MTWVTLLYAMMAYQGHGLEVRISSRSFYASLVGACVVGTCTHPSQAALTPLPIEDSMSTRQKVIRTTSNFLTNPVLENLRKSDQLERDEGGIHTEVLLVPILEIYDDLATIRDAVASSADAGSPNENIASVLKILEQSSYQVKSIKSFFNRYSDNIYYADPAESNLYLAGGATPSSRQTQQYLLRNQILTDIADIRDDLKSMKGATGMKAEDWRQLCADNVDDIEDALANLKEYLGMADPKDLSLAKKIFSVTKK